MVSAITIGFISGIAGFTVCVMIFGKRGSDKTREWLEPYWQKANTNGQRQADALMRIAIVLDRLPVPAVSAPKGEVNNGR